MATLKVRRIDLSQPNAEKLFAAIKNPFADQANVVSPASKKLTQSVFGEALPPVKVVERICEDVRKKGLSSLLHYTEQLDKVRLTPKQIRVSADELAAAYASSDSTFLESIARIRNNIIQFQVGLLNKDALMPDSEHYELQLRYRPLRRVGICIPGGAAAYPSSLVMTVAPAQAAEVKEIAVCMPPTPNGANNKDMLAACHLLGIKEVYRVGGAQAVAAMAYGVDGLEQVDMIVGPGNIYTSLAKKFVFGQVAIDCLAGPSEVVIIADESSQPELVAIDLIAQAEHAPGVAVLITWSPELIDDVEKSLNKQLNNVSRGDLARECLNEYGAFILVKDKAEAIKVTNELAPEHLHIMSRDPEALAEKIDNAGAMFIGQFSPVALGDYAAGPSHVLPTGGTARFASGLTVNDFRRRTSIINFTRTGLKRIAEDVLTLANKEGLTAHAASVQARVNDKPPTVKPPKKPVAKVKK